MEAGLSAPRKTNIAAHKQAQVEELLAARFIRVCESGECVTKARTDGRERVMVPTSECEMCAGGNAEHALAVMFEHLATAGIRRVLVVGGSPTVHAELSRRFAATKVALDIVDGERALDARRAEALATRADVIVVWGSTLLGHRVSTLFTQPKYGAKRVPLARRGLRSFADAVTEHVRLSRASSRT